MKQFYSLRQGGLEISAAVFLFVTNQTLFLRRMSSFERGTPARPMAYEACIVVPGVSVKAIIRNQRNFFTGRDKEQDEKNNDYENDQR